MLIRAPIPHCHVSSRASQTFKAFHATSYGSFRNKSVELDDGTVHENDFILSILKTNPQLRDTRGYLSNFGLKSKRDSSNQAVRLDDSERSPILASILNPVQRRTALVKIQGPFTTVQLDSICRGLVYLEKLGLVCVIVVENDNLARGTQDERASMIEECMRVVSTLERLGTRARPLLDPVVRLGPKLDISQDTFLSPPEAHTSRGDLNSIQSALRAGEIPVIPPFALDSFCRSVRVDANDVTAALVQGMAEAGVKCRDTEGCSELKFSDEVDLTPLRLMIINREGGVPSYARSGLPHLLVNLESEYSYIHETFQPPWKYSHPSALSNLALARRCLSYMPNSSSAVMVSHRSPSSLIANLITNKPAVSSSLPHALLQGNRKLTPHTPTLLRRGLPIQVLRTIDELDKDKMTILLEKSFKRTLDQKAFYDRLSKRLDFMIIAGDYVGTAIVTNEGPGDNEHSRVSYLDKFAVLPDHQGDGTVDFLWVALHDESYGLGHPFSANPNGGKGGQGEGRDLVWRSRANNPVNKWYFERSTGHARFNDWVLFWCDAEKRLKREAETRDSPLSFIENRESGRIPTWANIVMKIPSVWK